MAGFKDIVGQKSVIAHIKKAIEAHTVSHAYIINGESGMGKKMLAEIFSTTLQCERGTSEPCMECRSCRQAAGRNHPDIKWVSHEKPASISVEEIREQLVNDMAIKPYSGRYKIYIIDEGEKMTPAAQNALLKTIEEPPSYGVIMILSANKEMLLQTILSRCVSLNLRPIPNNDIKYYLINNQKTPDYQAVLAARFAGGNLGRAIDIVSSDSFVHMKEDVVRALKNIDRMTASDMNQTIKEMSAYKNVMDSYLNLVTMWFRDVLLYKCANHNEMITFIEEESVIAKQAAQAEYDGLQEIFSELQTFKGRIKSNVNFDIAMELLFLKMRAVLRSDTENYS